MSNLFLLPLTEDFWKCSGSASLSVFILKCLSFTTVVALVSLVELSSKVETLGVSDVLG